MKEGGGLLRPWCRQSRIVGAGCVPEAEGRGLALGLVQLQPEPPSPHVVASKEIVVLFYFEPLKIEHLQKNQWVRVAVERTPGVVRV